MLNISLWLRLLLAALLAFAVSYFMTPPVKHFAEHVGAVDVPKDARRVHDHPIPRMGGIAIFFGIVAAMLVFVEVDTRVLGVLIGALIIAVMGAVDDIMSLKPWIKLLAQIAAALVAIRCGVVFDAVTAPVFQAELETISIGWYSVPLTVLWIVGCTNAVNLIDGLDGLAVGVSAISSLTMMIVALIVADPYIAVILAAITGSCLGFVPYNKNPAVIFMGDVGSQTLGFLLASVSILGMFKLHALITFLVPILALAVPLCDTAFAFIRRILRGQSPFHADKGHFHHRLLAIGLNQKQAVAVLYGVSAVLGLLAVLLTGGNTAIKIICVIAVFIISVAVWLYVFWHNPNLKHHRDEHKTEQK